MRVIFTLLSLMILKISYSGIPVWTFTPNPLHPPSHSITTNGSAIVQYTVTNQSHKTHTLIMQPINGVTQDTSPGNCSYSAQLVYQQSCKLTLNVNGASISGDINGGPILCQNGSSLQCYQPAINDQLNIRLIQPTIFAGTSVGYLYSSSDNGITWILMNSPAPNYAINSIYSKSSGLYFGSEDGHVYFSYDDGYSWSSSTSPDNSAINGLFVNSNNIIYAGTQSGNVFYSNDNGNTWIQTNALPDSGAVNGLFIKDSTIYVARGNGNIYFSTDNGNNWTTIAGPLANVSVQNIYATNDKLYVNTRQTSSNSSLPPGTINIENVYYSDSLTNPSTWTLYSWISFSIFVNSDASKILAGTQNGHIFSLSTGDNLGFIIYSPITSLFYRHT